MRTVAVADVAFTNMAFRMKTMPAIALGANFRHVAAAFANDASIWIY